MWRHIVSHDAVAEQFRQSLRAGRLATTYLFVGPAGVGKRTFANELAKALLCTTNEAASLEPCGQCESCRLAAAGNHPDLHIVERQPGAKFLKVEQFIGARDHRNREGLCFEMQLRPLISQRRVAIIDDADWFNAEGANSLLKMLEEPPPHAVIILIGTSRSRQLPTILSRSQVVQFQPLESPALAGLLIANGLAGDVASAAKLADLSGGSVSRAREIVDDSLAPLRDSFAAQWGAGRIDALRLAREIDQCVANAGKEADVRRQRLRQYFAQVGDVLRGSLRRHVATGELPALVEATLAALDRTIEAEEELDRNANQSTLVECWLDDLVTSLAFGSEPASV